MVTHRLRHAEHHIGYPKTCEGLHRQNVVEMGKATAIYIREGDLPLWERVERYARERRMPVSGLVMLAVEEYLARHDQASDDRK